MRIRPVKFTIGTWVWCFIPRRRPKRSHKWQSFYEGPFLVTKELGAVNVEIQRTARSRPTVVHIDKLKPCYTQGLRSWLLQANDHSATEQQDTLRHVTEAVAPDCSEHGDNTDRESEISRAQDVTTDQSDDERAAVNDTPAQLPKRLIRRPARFC